MPDSANPSQPDDLTPKQSDTMELAKNTSRRGFLGHCSASVALAYAATESALTATAGQQVTRFAPVNLVNDAGEPLGCDDLEVNREYIFAYPFTSTPCFLINLGKPLAGGLGLKREDGAPYTWLGGIGKAQSVVAFSAICAHKLSHPSPAVSFIGYRAQPVGFYNRQTEQVEQRAGVIQCCSEHSLYDPAQGAKVMSGPAPQPLAAIELREQDGQLQAIGVYGGELFQRFFEQFSNRLMIQHQGDSYADPVGQVSTVVPGEIYSQNRIECG